MTTFGVTQFDSIYYR
jgi:hypothetical protein